MLKKAAITFLFPGSMPATKWVSESSRPTSQDFTLRFGADSVAQHVRRFAVNIVAYDFIPEDKAFAEQWNALVQTMESPQVFYTWEWARAVAAAYPERKPRLFAGYSGGLLTGVVALAIERDHDRTFFLTATTADYCDFISAPNERATFVQAAIAHLRKLRTSKLELASIPDR